MHDILVEEKILAGNDAAAARNRGALRKRGIFTVNMVSAPGAGKTSVIERAIPYLRGAFGGIAVIEGDVETELDSLRIARHGVPVRQITTGRACHLDARLIADTLPWVFGLPGVGALIIENVGNLVCPAEFDLGEDLTIAILSTAEGDDKPLKYPSIFHSSDALIINKVDLLPHTDFDMRTARERALRVNPGIRVFETSCTTGAGIMEWCAYLAAAATSGKGA
jgi:hydrogenase nickel incorporation protein HypB